MMDWKKENFAKLENSFTCIALKNLLLDQERKNKGEEKEKEKESEKYNLSSFLKLETGCSMI